VKSEGEGGRGWESRKTEWERATEQIEVTGTYQTLDQDKLGLCGSNIASCRGWRGERSETGRGGEAKKRDNFSPLCFHHN
jgi:hypothetical protein